MNKACWSRFQSLLGSKDVASTRFTQIAELRNGIRHSRTVDEVTRKEGEAALIWFDGVLARGVSADSNEVAIESPM